MTELEKSALLYTRMAERMEQNGFCDRQAAVYRESAAFVRRFSDENDAMEAMRASHLYLAPSLALLSDKLAAQARAAAENGMPEVERVLRAQLQKLQEDPGALHDSAYLAEAQAARACASALMEAFCRLYEHFFAIQTASPFDRHLQAAEAQKIADCLALFSRQGASFSALSKQPSYRALLPCSDGGFAAFCAFIESGNFAQSGAAEAAGAIEQEAAAAWQAVLARKEDILAAGRAALAKAASAQAIALPPTDAGGGYRFIGEEVQPLV